MFDGIGFYISLMYYFSQHPAVKNNPQARKHSENWVEDLFAQFERASARSIESKLDLN